MLKLFDSNVNIMRLHFLIDFKSICVDFFTWAEKNSAKWGYFDEYNVISTVICNRSSKKIISVAIEFIQQLFNQQQIVRKGKYDRTGTWKNQDIQFY